MTQLIAGLLHKVGSIAQRADENLLAEIVTAWSGPAEMWVIREALVDWFENSADISNLRMAARETPTHYVWPLALSNSGYSIAINEFKEPRRIRVGYATTLHDHRYSFVSLVLSGGYTQVRSNVEILDTDQARQIRELGKDTVAEGDIVTVNHADFHQLTAISERAITLVVKCPAVKQHSLSVDAGTLRVTRHVPVEARVGQLMHALVPAYDKGR